MRTKISITYSCYHMHWWITYFQSHCHQDKNLLQVELHFLTYNNMIFVSHAYVHTPGKNIPFLANTLLRTSYVTVILFIGTDCTYVFFQNLHHHTYVLLHWVYEIEFYKFLYFSRVCSEISYLSLQHVQH